MALNNSQTSRLHKWGTEGGIFSWQCLVSGHQDGWPLLQQQLITSAAMLPAATDLVGLAEQEGLGVYEILTINKACIYVSNSYF